MLGLGLKRILVYNLACAGDELERQGLWVSFNEHSPIILIIADQAFRDLCFEIVKAFSACTIHDVRKTIYKNAFIGMIVSGENYVCPPLLIRPLHILC